MWLLMPDQEPRDQRSPMQVRMWENLPGRGRVHHRVHRGQGQLQGDWSRTTRKSHTWQSPRGQQPRASQPSRAQASAPWREALAVLRMRERLLPHVPSPGPEARRPHREPEGRLPALLQDRVGKEPNECSACARAFSRKANLVRRHRVHTRAQLYGWVADVSVEKSWHI